MTLEYKFINLQLLDFDTKSNSPGILKGYANVTAEIDDGGDIILPGAFQDGIDEFLKTGFLAHSHDWGVASGQIGYPVVAREDDHGFYVEAEFHSTPDAQIVRTKAAERMNAGKQVGLSIGYRPSATPAYITPDQYASELPKYVKPSRLAENLAKAQLFSRIRLLSKVENKEFSIVTSPMNKLSEATAIKSNEGEKTMDKIEEKKEESLQVESESPPAPSQSYFKNLFALIALKSPSHAGVSFSEHSETALAAIEEFAQEAAALAECLTAYSARGKAIQDIRAKEGRAISAARMERMRAACDRIKSTMTEMQSVHDHLMAIMDEAAMKPDEPKGEETPEVKEVETPNYSAEALAFEASILNRRFQQIAAVRAA